VLANDDAAAAILAAADQTDVANFFNDDDAVVLRRGATAIAVLAVAGYGDLLPASDYSYVFTGLSDTMDYALASASLAPQVARAAVWHSNADEPRALDDNEEFKSAGQLLSLYSPDAYRSADHDPLLVRLQWGQPQTRSLWLPLVEAERQSRPWRRCAAARRSEQDHGCAGRGAVH
jgi:predicted extracellular nuclease